MAKPSSGDAKTNGNSSLLDVEDLFKHFGLTSADVKTQLEQLLHS